MTARFSKDRTTTNPHLLILSKKTIVVWFSCGAASTVAAKKTIELYGNSHSIRVVNNPIKEEDSDNLRKHHPQVFEERAVLSRELGCRLVQVKGERIFLDELDPNTKGRPLKGMDFECGIFCEEQLDLFTNNANDN